MRRSLVADPQTTIWRVLNGECDDVPGLVLDRYGDVLIAQLHPGRLRLDESRARQIAIATAERLGLKSIYRKVFPKDRSQAAAAEVNRANADPGPWWGAPTADEVRALENGLTLLVRPYDGFSVGVFAEQRLNRQRIRAMARGGRVLNLFAYTCGFSVAAAIGGAVAVDSVDLARRFLEWGKRNLAANALPLESHRFFAADVVDYFRRAERQQKRFDLIILDPPTFSRARESRRVLSLPADWPTLLASCTGLLDSSGKLLICTNRRETTYAELEKFVRGATDEQGLRIERLPLPVDFAGDPDFSKSILVHFGGNRR